jgi:hypothetical protein
LPNENRRIGLPMSLVSKLEYIKAREFGNRANVLNGYHHLVIWRRPREVALVLFR